MNATAARPTPQTAPAREPQRPASRSSARSARRGPRRRRAREAPPVRAVLERVLDAITRVRRDRGADPRPRGRGGEDHRARALRAPAGVARPRRRPPRGRLSVAAHRVLREVLAAIRRAAPGIAEPILAEAVDSERLTAAQQQRILERLRTSPGGLLGRRPTVDAAQGVSSAA